MNVKHIEVGLNSNIGLRRKDNQDSACASHGVYVVVMPIVFGAKAILALFQCEAYALGSYAAAASPKAPAIASGAICRMGMPVWM